MRYLTVWIACLAFLSPFLSFSYYYGETLLAVLIDSFDYFEARLYAFGAFMVESFSSWQLLFYEIVVALTL